MTPQSPAAERPADLLDLAWRISASALTAGILSAALALLLAAAALISQQPAGLAAGAAERWVAAAIARYGVLGPALAAAGAFNIFNGPALAIGLALLAFHLLVRLATGAAAAWRVLRLPPGLPPAGPAPKLAPLVASLDDAGERARRLLAAAGYDEPVVVLTSPGHTVWFAGRRRPGVFGPLVAQLGALLILGALLVNAAAGWTSPEVTLAPGSAAPLLAATGLQARLEALTGPDDRPVAVSAQDSSGRPVLLQAQTGVGRAGEPLRILFTAVQSEQVFAVPDRNVAFRVVDYPALPGQGITRTAFLIEAYRGTDSTPALNQLVGDRAILTLDDVTYTLAPERHIVLAASYWPGLWLLALGALTLLAGLAMALWWDYRSVWITLVAEGAEVLALVRVVAGLGADHERDGLAAALAAGKAAP